MHRRLEFTLSLAAAVVISAVISTLALPSSSKDRDPIAMGKLSDCRSGYVKINNQVFYLTPSTQVLSPARDRVALSQLCQQKLVQVYYRMYRGRRIAKKIKLMHGIGAGQLQSQFAGTVGAVKGNRLDVGDHSVHFDEFTMRIGQALEKKKAKDWIGEKVAVVAVQNQRGDWFAEAIHLVNETTAMAK